MNAKAELCLYRLGNNCLVCFYHDQTLSAGWYVYGPYEVDLDLIKSHRQYINAIIKGPRPNIDKIRDHGQAIYNELFREPTSQEIKFIRDRLCSLANSSLFITSNMNNQIIWPLLHDGDAFWGTKYRLGIKHPNTRPEYILNKAVNRCFMIVDPNGDLHNLRKDLSNSLACELQLLGCNVNLIAGESATTAGVNAELENRWDLIIFGCHADKKGLLLYDGKLTADSLSRKKLNNAIIFIPTCNDATCEDSIFYALQKAGAIGGFGSYFNYVPASPVGDFIGKCIALTLLNGESIGEAYRSCFIDFLGEGFVAVPLVDPSLSLILENVKIEWPTDGTLNPAEFRQDVHNFLQIIGSRLKAGGESELSLEKFASAIYGSESKSNPKGNKTMSSKASVNSSKTYAMNIKMSSALKEFLMLVRKSTRNDQIGLVDIIYKMSRPDPNIEELLKSQGVYIIDVFQNLEQSFIPSEGLNEPTLLKLEREFEGPKISAGESDFIRNLDFRADLSTVTDIAKSQDKVIDRFVWKKMLKEFAQKFQEVTGIDAIEYLTQNDLNRKDEDDEHKAK